MCIDAEADLDPFTAEQDRSLIRWFERYRIWSEETGDGRGQCGEAHRSSHGHSRQLSETHLTFVSVRMDYQVIPRLMFIVP